MARSDLLLTLVRAGMAGDRGLLRATAEALAAEERANKHTVLADKLSKIIHANGHRLSPSNSAPNGLTLPGRDFIAETIPQRPMSELVLSDIVREQANNLIEEQHRADLLRSHGLQPRHRVLLCGPPGNGKTALAEAMAEALAVPFLVVRYDALIGSFLGETTQRLRKLFDYVRTIPCVLLFDEFDAIGKERGDVHETGEIKRVVSSLLMQVDTLPSYVVVVGATNHAELLDRAVWRRFQLRLDMPAPTRRQLAEFFTRAFTSLAETAPIDVRPIAGALGPVSYAEATEFLVDLQRRRVLSLGQKRFVDIIAEQLPLWSARSKVHSNGARSEQTTTEVRPTDADPAREGPQTGSALPTSVLAGASGEGTRSQTRRAGKSTRGRR